MSDYDKPIEEDSNGNRYIVRYEGNKVYIVVTDNSFDIAGVSTKIPQRTRVAFGIINRLATRLIEDETDLEDLGGMILSESREKGDLADILFKAIVREIEKNESQGTS